MVLNLINLITANVMLYVLLLLQALFTGSICLVNPQNVYAVGVLYSWYSIASTIIVYKRIPQYYNNLFFDVYKNLTKRRKSIDPC